MDELDYQIADMLDKNSRASNREIARRIGVSEKTVRIRINRMIENGNLKIAAMINVENMPDVFLAVCSIRLQNNLIDIEDCISEIQEMPEVLSVMSVTGRYDLIAIIVVNSKMMLTEILTKKIGKMEGINTLETYVVLNNAGYIVPVSKLYAIMNDHKSKNR